MSFDGKTTSDGKIFSRFNSPAPSYDEFTRRIGEANHKSFNSSQRPNFIFDAKSGSRHQLVDKSSKNSKLGKENFLRQQTGHSFATQNRMNNSLITGVAAVSEHDVSEIVAQAEQSRWRKLAANELLY